MLSGIAASDRILVSRGPTVLTVSGQRAAVWRIDRATVHVLSASTYRVYASAFTPAARALHVVDRTGILSVSLTTGQVERWRRFADLDIQLEALTRVHLFDDRQLLLSTNGMLSLIDIKTWKIVWSRGKPSNPYIGLPQVELFTADTKTFRMLFRAPFASEITLVEMDAADGRTIVQWSTKLPFQADNYLFTPMVLGHGSYIAATDASRRGYLISTRDGTVARSFDPDVRFEQLHPHRKPVLDPKRFREVGYVITPTFMNDGRRIAFNAGDPRGRGTIRFFIYDLETGLKLGDHDRPAYLTSAYADAASDDVILIGSGGSVSRFDLERQATVTAYSGHPNGVAGFADDRAGGHVASVGVDGRIYVSDRATGVLLTTIILREDDWLSITPEGFYAGSTGLTAEVGIRLPSLEFLRANRVSRDLRRPDLVAEKLAGDRTGRIAQAATETDVARIVRSDAAPAVRLQARETSPDGVMTASIRVEPRGYGIGYSEWRLNGRLIATDDLHSPGDQPRMLERRIELDPGLNQIEVTAYDATGLIGSEPLVLEAVAPALSSQPRRLFVLAVGVDRYADPRLKLNFSVADAQAIVEALARRARGLYQTVETRLLTNDDVRRGTIASSFEELSKQVTSRDIFVLFVAGHGKSIDGRYYFLPQDFLYKSDASISAGGISDDDWARWITTIKAQDTLLLFDTCESGTLTASQQSPGNSVDALERVGLTLGRALLTAASGDRPAAEGYRGHGLFTYSVLEALAAGDTSGDRITDIRELANYLDRHVPETGWSAFRMTQTPQMFLAGRNFPLARAGPSEGVGAAPVRRDREPTHVTIEAALVSVSDDPSAQLAGEVPLGTMVRVVATSRGRVLVSRLGYDVGWIDARAVVQLR
jgi:hypothetical protein